MVNKKMIYNNLILNQEIWSQLTNMVENNKLPHALIFSGSDGVGKEAHAIELAGLLNMKKGQTNLTKIQRFQHPNINLIIPFPREKNINKKSDMIDCLSNKSLEKLLEMKLHKMENPYSIIEFDKASSILINSIRDIKKKSKFSINEREGAIVHIIFQAEKLCSPRTESGNALLKILEEPPPNTFFILVTNHKEKMLDTILSRCCDFYFPKISNQKINTYIHKHYNIGNSDLLISICNGSIKQINHIIDSKIDIENTIKDGKKLISSIIQNKNWQAHYKKMEKLFKSDKQSFKIFIKIIIFILNDLEKIKNNIFDCLILSDVQKVKSLDYNKCIYVIEETYQKLYKNINPAMGLFTMFLKLNRILVDTKK